MAPLQARCERVLKPIQREHYVAMMQHMHFLGAFGSGTTTLRRALAERLQWPHGAV
jgi:hypothetical protein